VNQRIILNRLGDGSIEILRSSLQIPLRPGREETFSIYMENRGDPVRVAFEATGEISNMVLFLRDNVLIEGEATIPIKVRMPDGMTRALQGRIEISTRYAASGEGFNLVLGTGSPQEIEYQADVVSREEPDFTEGIVPVETVERDDEKPSLKEKLNAVRTEKPADRMQVFKFRGMESGELLIWVLVVLLVAFLFTTFYLGWLSPLWGGVASSILLVFLALRLTFKMFGRERGGGEKFDRRRRDTESTGPKEFEKL